MRNVLNPFQFIVIAIAGWMNQKQQYAIDYLREENRVLREQLGTRRLRFTDDQRRRLAAKAKLVGRRLLNDIAELVYRARLWRILPCILLRADTREWQSEERWHFLSMLVVCS